MVSFLSKPVECEGFEQIATVKAKTVNGEVQLQALVDTKKVIITKSTIRDLQLEDAEGIDCLPNAAIFEQLTLISMVKNLDSVGKFLMYPRFVQVFLDKQVGEMSSHNKIYVTPSHTKKVFGNMRSVGKDEAVNEEMDDSLERVATTATSLDAEQDRGNIHKTQSKTRSENVSKLSNDPLLARGNILQSGEDRLKHKELMELCTTLQSRALALETTNTTQAMEITSLKRRVKKLERRNKSRTHKLKRLYKVGLSTRVESFEEEDLGEEDASKQGRIAHIDDNEEITLISTHFDVDIDMFGVHDLDGVEVFDESEEPVVNAATTTSTIPVSVAKVIEVDITLAQALAELKSAKPKAVTTASIRPKATRLVIQEQEQAPTLIISSKDKGKGIMLEEPLKMKKKDQISFDKQEAIRLQAKFDDEERLAIEKYEANVALTKQ
ncbi:hypothetical protein Tco_0945258 [Tanacetum coccineum]